LECVVREFSEAALRVKRARFDAVEIHAAHGYLLNTFFSPLTNLRIDEYGGSLDGRLLLLLEVVAAVRGSVGEDYPVAVRLGTLDNAPSGTTIEDAVAAAVALERESVDLIDLTRPTPSARPSDPRFARSW
jgi:2,4-dienoyl-CoA reductase-like NADH-dependent reductase (Old Yellow Enzyme family)